ncbi:MAG TPA: alpha/beta fold hydrolase [Myxococcaceae bacterium]|nr:alpha/beta fold hydrolase [Myxococcaceae bacterium]
MPVPAWLRAGFQVTSAVSPQTAGRLALKLFFTPQRLRARPEERKVLAGGVRFTLTAGEAPVVGWAWGSGPAVLLVHGWSGNAAQMTALVQPLVEAGFQPVALDMPAHGESGGSLSSLVHFESALRQATALFAPVHGLIGHSFGAAAATFALSRGLPVGRAVYFASPSRFDSFWSRFRAGLGVTDAVWSRMMRRAEQWLEVRFDEIAPATLAPSMKVPLLVFHDRGDREVAYDEGVELTGAWPGARLETLERLGHRRLLSDPSCISATLDFLRRQAPKSVPNLAPCVSPKTFAP